MHPSKVHQNTGAPSSALRLGFTDPRPIAATEPSSYRGLQSTPSHKSVVPSSDFTFRIAQEAAGIQLSSQAQEMMQELREQAAKIKTELRAMRELEAQSHEALAERKLAQPKSKSSRVSAVHMAELKKMDSIENHASIWRAQDGRFTPFVQKGVKRSQSKARLDDSATKAKPSVPGSTPTSAKASTPQMKLSTKRSSTVAGLDNSTTRANLAALGSSKSSAETLPFSLSKQSTPFMKRLKKTQTDDASTARPMSRDGSSLPRPASSRGQGLTHSQSVFSRLTSPSKTSLASLSVNGRSTISLVSNGLQSSTGGLTRSNTTQSFSASRAGDLKRRIISPGRFDKIKSILRGRKDAGGEDKTAIPGPADTLAQTSRSLQVDKDLPPLPSTTPRRRLTKRVAFTPDTKRAALTQNSPSPQKGASSNAGLIVGSGDLAAYPSLNEVLARGNTDAVVYPDLSSLKQRLSDVVTINDSVRAPSVPGAFTFRSDHTIEFGPSPAAGFGASPGQSSVRQVRQSAISNKSEMPGGFPAASQLDYDKENDNPNSKPLPCFGRSHGLPEKKRRRSYSGGEDTMIMDAERSAKKRKGDHNTAQSSATPSSVKKSYFGLHTPRRNIHVSPTKTPTRGTPGSSRPVLSMRRLEALARPKHKASPKHNAVFS